MKIDFRKKEDSTTSELVIVYSFRIKKKNLPSLTLFPSLCLKKGGIYKDEKELAKILYNAYGSNINITPSVRGKLANITVSITVPNPKYVGEDSFIDVLKLSKDMIYASSSRFEDESQLELVKEEYLKRLKNIEEQDQVKSIYKALQQIDKSDIDNYPIYYSKGAIKKTKTSDIIALHKLLLNSSSVSIYYEGNEKKAEIKKLINEVYGKVSQRVKKAKCKKINIEKAKETIVEGKNDFQSITTLLFSFTSSNKEAPSIFKLYSDEVLFKELRERLGFCYFIVSKADILRGFLMVVAYVGNDVLTEANDKIKEILPSMEITSKSVNNQINKRLAKLESLKDDELISYVSFLEARRSIGLITDLEKIKEATKSVSVDDLKEIQSSLKLISLYSTSGKGGHKN